MAIRVTLPGRGAIDFDVETARILQVGTLDATDAQDYVDSNNPDQDTVEKVIDATAVPKSYVDLGDIRRWDATTNYLAQDYVVHEGRLFFANADNTNVTPVPRPNEVSQWSELERSDFFLQITANDGSMLTADDHTHNVNISGGNGITTEADDASDTLNINLTAGLSNLSDVSDTAPSVNQILEYNGTEWVPVTNIGGGYSIISADTGADVEVTNTRDTLNITGGDSDNPVNTTITSTSTETNVEISVEPAVAGTGGHDGLLTSADKGFIDDVRALNPAPLDSPEFTGTPRAPTPTDVDDDSTRIATTSFVHNATDLLPVLKMPSNPADLDPTQLNYSVTFWRPHLSTTHTTTVRLSDINVSGTNPTSVLNDQGTAITLDANNSFTIANVNPNYTLVFDQQSIDALTRSNTLITFSVRYNNGTADDRSVFGVLTGDGGGSVESLNDLSDVDVSTADQGEVLTRQADGTWVGVHPMAIEDHGGREWNTVVTYESGDIVSRAVSGTRRLYIALRENTNVDPTTSTDDWQEIQTEVETLNTIGNVNITSPIEGQALSYDLDSEGNATWVNRGFTARQLLPTTQYHRGELVYTSDDTAYPVDHRDQIYRVNGSFTSPATFEPFPTNLRYLGERDNTDVVTDDDVTLNSFNEITAITVGTDERAIRQNAKSGSRLPTASESLAGDIFVLEGNTESVHTDTFAGSDGVIDTDQFGNNVLIFTGTENLVEYIHESDNPVAINGVPTPETGQGNGRYSHSFGAQILNQPPRILFDTPADVADSDVITFTYRVAVTVGDQGVYYRSSDNRSWIKDTSEFQHGVRLPATATTGDGFILTATDGTNQPGYYYYTTEWVKDTSTYTAGTGLTLSDTNEFSVDNPYNPNLPINTWNSSTTYAIGDQVLFVDHSDNPSVFIAAAANTNSPPTSSIGANNPNWTLVRSGITALQTNAGSDTTAGGITTNSILHINSGTGIRIDRNGTTFSIQQHGTGHTDAQDFGPGWAFTFYDLSSTDSRGTVIGTVGESVSDYTTRDIGQFTLGDVPNINAVDGGFSGLTNNNLYAFVTNAGEQNQLFFPGDAADVRRIVYVEASDDGVPSTGVRTLNILNIDPRANTLGELVTDTGGQAARNISTTVTLFALDIHHDTPEDVPADWAKQGNNDDIPGNKLGALDNAKPENKADGTPLGTIDSSWLPTIVNDLEDLGNVTYGEDQAADQPSPEAGQYLRIRSTAPDGSGGTTVEWENNSITLADINEFNISGATAGQFIRFSEESPGRWENFTAALSSLSDVSNDINNAQTGDGFGFIEGQGWVRRPNATPPYPSDQLAVAGETNTFLYELRVDVAGDGQRSITWMETPGIVRLSIEDRPDVNESETAFRRAPSTYVVSGFTGQDVGSVGLNIDVNAFRPDPGPLVWGNPSSRNTLFSDQNLLYFFGARASGEDWFLRETSSTIEMLQGRTLHVNIDYAGVIRVSADPSDEDNRVANKTTRLAASDDILAPLRAAIPPGEYTGTVFEGRSYDPENATFGGIWWVGFTELLDRSGVRYRVPEPPVQGNQWFGGVQFGTDNTDGGNNIAGTLSTVSDVRDASTVPSDPIFVFQHGGQVAETAIAGSTFVDVTRRDPTTAIPYPTIQVTPSSVNPVVGISALDNAGGVVTNPSTLDARTSGIGQNRFPQVSAGTGIELRGTSDNLEIINTFMETDSDTVTLRPMRSVPRTQGQVRPEFVRGEDLYQQTPLAISYNVLGQRTITYSRRGSGTDERDARLSFDLLVPGATGTPSPYAAGNIVRVSFRPAFVALLGDTIDEYTYTAQVISVGAERAGTTGAVAYPMVLGSFKHVTGGLDIEGPASPVSIIPNTSGFVNESINLLDVSITADNDTDIFDPFIKALHTPNIDENSAIRFVGGNGINVFENINQEFEFENARPQITISNDGQVISSSDFINTDLSGDPTVTNTDIPVVNAVTYNAENDANVLRLGRNGDANADLTATFGAAASRGVVDAITLDFDPTDVDQLPTAGAVRDVDTALRAGVANQIANQKLEDHHGVQPVFQHGGRTAFAQTQRDVRSDGANINRRTDNNTGQLLETFSALTFFAVQRNAQQVVTSGAMLVNFENTSDGSWVVGNTVNRETDSVVEWSGTVRYVGAAAETVTLSNGGTFNVPASGSDNFRVLIEIDSSYFNRFTNNPHLWLQSSSRNIVGGVEENTNQYYFIAHNATDEADIWFENVATVVTPINLTDVVYVRTAGGTYEWEARGIDTFGSSIDIQSAPPSEPTVGQGWVDNDNGVESIWNGHTWVQIGGPGTNAGQGGGSGSVTEIQTGDGLQGGPITDTGTIQVDSTVARVNGNIGTATATTPALFSSDTSVATTAFVHSLVDILPVLAMPKLRRDIDTSVVAYSFSFWRPHYDSNSRNLDFRISDIDITGLPANGIVSITRPNGTVITNTNENIPIETVNSDYLITFTTAALQNLVDNASAANFAVTFEVDIRDNDTVIDNLYGLVSGSGAAQTHGNPNSITLTSPDGNQSFILAATDGGRLTISVNGTVTASIGTDGIRAIDNINDPDPTN